MKRTIQSGTINVFRFCLRCSLTVLCAPLFLRHLSSQWKLHTSVRYENILKLNLSYTIFGFSDIALILNIIVHNLSCRT